MKLFKKNNSQDLVKENNTLKLKLEELQNEKKDNIFSQFEEYQKLVEKVEIQKEQIKKLKEKINKFKEMNKNV